MNCASRIGILFAWVFSIQVGSSFEETVYYRPILIQKYKDANITNEHFTSWMDIQNGVYPNISLDDIEPIGLGMPISILVYLNSQQNYDMDVNECWAYNQQNYRLSTMKLSLTENNTVAQKKNNSVLINAWTKRSYSMPQNMTILLYTNITAFRFPGNNYVYIACTVEICPESCNASLVTDDLSNITTSDGPLQTATPGSVKLFFDKLTQATKIPTSTNHELTTTATNYNCVTEYTTCSSRESTPPTESIRGINTKPASSDCSPESNIDPRCAAVNPPNCAPGSSDPRCTSITYPVSTTVKPTTVDCQSKSLRNECTTEASTISNLMYNPFLPPNCYPSSKDPRCKMVELQKPLHTYQYGSSKPPNCYPGSKDDRCKTLL